MDIAIAKPLQGEALDFAHSEGVVRDEGAIKRGSVLGDGGAGVLEEIAPFQNAVQNMVGGNPEALAGSDGQPIPQKILATDNERIDLPGKALFPRRGDHPNPLDARLLGKRDVVVVSGGRLRSGQTDFFIGRGQERKRLRRCKGLLVNSSGLAKS